MKILPKGHLQCKNCGEVEAYITTSGMHQKATCSLCGSFIKFISKKEFAFIEEADREEDIDVKESLRELHFKVDLILHYMDIIEDTSND